MSNLRVRLLVVLFFGMVFKTCFAQDSAAQSIAVGETKLTPAVRIDYLSIDNLFRKSSGEVAATGILVSPELVWKADRRLLSLDATYSGEYASYSEDDVADYDDHSFSVSTLGELTSRHRLSARLNIGLGHEEQGIGQTGASPEINPELIETRDINGQIGYSFGAKSARGNLRAGLRIGSVTFSNLEELTDGDDYTSIRPYGIFALRVSPDTRLLAEIRLGVLDFDDSRRDRNEVRFLTGLEMSTSRKLGGDFRFGVLKASFDEVSSADTTEFVAEVGLFYKPLSFSRFDLSFERTLETVDEGDRDAGRSVNDDFDLVWTHEWSSWVETRSKLSVFNVDRECFRVDERTTDIGIELNFKVRRWLSFGVSASESSRDVQSCPNSTNTSIAQDFDRSQVGAHVRATL